MGGNGFLREVSSMRRRFWLAALLPILLALWPVLPAVALPPRESAAPAADFNADGYADLAVGVPSESVDGQDQAGAVNVLYGMERGLSAAGNQLWHQNSPGVLGVAGQYDTFGSSLAQADFDGDGFTDLAVGARTEDEPSAEYAGAVSVLHGSAVGLLAQDNQFWSQDSPGVSDTPEYSDLFGHSLVAGDFDADGYADLAIGVPNEDTGGESYSGAVHVLYGSPAGLAVRGNDLLSQDTPGIQDHAEFGDGFGSALTSGDVNGDGATDLAVASGHESLGEIESAGAVHILYGSPSGLSAEGDQFWGQDSPGVEGEADHHEDFGWFALSAADFDGDGFADIAIGVTGEATSGKESSGAVNVLYGSAKGLLGAGSQLWHQDVPGVADRAEIYDQFGFDLGAGDFNGDGLMDLVIGVPSEGLLTADEGAAHILYGSPGGLFPAGAQFWTQDSPGVEDAAERGDMFGATVLAGAWLPGAEDDLAIAATWEDVPSGSRGYDGVVHVLRGAPEGLTGQDDQLWSQETPGVRERAEEFDSFGSSLA
jgi:hypothetical protein